MKLAKFVNLFLLSVSTVMLISCGSGSSTQAGTGNTVYLTAGVKTGTGTAVVSLNLTPGAPYVSVPAQNINSFTVNSFKYSTTSAIPASDVLINNVVYSYTLISPAGAPVLPDFAVNAGFTVTAGASTDLVNFQVIEDVKPDATKGLGKINAHALTAPAGTVYKYKVTAKFNCTEVNTGLTLSPNVVETNVWVTIP